MNAPVTPSRMNLPGSSHAASGNALELRGITKMFGALAAISDVTLSVKPGERRAVLGSNGAGTTTLFNCITGDFLPTAGLIRFFGEDVTAFPPYERIRRVFAKLGVQVVCAAGDAPIPLILERIERIRSARSLIDPGRS